MKKRVLAVALACGIALSFASCAKRGKGFELGHFDGSDTANGYDSELLYQNTSEFWAGTAA